MEIPTNQLKALRDMLGEILHQDDMLRGCNPALLKFIRANSHHDRVDPHKALHKFIQAASELDPPEEELTDEELTEQCVASPDNTFNSPPEPGEPEPRKPDPVEELFDMIKGIDIPPIPEPGSGRNALLREALDKAELFYDTKKTD